ncbi:MAG TPA: GGDEF domain-containing protein [Gallionellaceae bacterium]|nr:GGDEF domain-containing protein [Gallionellaceae bacterium]
MPVSSKFALLAAVLILVGCGLLASVLFRLHRLYLRVPLRIIRTRQYPAAALLAVCMAAYLAYLFSAWNTHKNWHDMIVPAVLCGTAATIWLLCSFTLQPALNLLLQQEIISDPLLGIYNHRHIERRLAEEVARAQRYNSPLSVFLLDVDHLAQINQRYSRAVGDQVLIHVAQLLHEYLRESDEVARYGPDEILVVTPSTSIADAHQLAERIRQRIVAQPLLLHARTENEERVEFSVSMGVATIQGSFDSLEKLLQRAETALQQASRAGGNRVQISEPGAA